MKRVVLILVLVVLALVLFVRVSHYAPPRDENTILPFVEPSPNYPAPDNQSNVFIDAGGWANRLEHPLAPFLQANILSNVQSYGSFVGLESSSGDAPMYVIEQERFVEEEGTCPRSVARLVNSNTKMGPGTYPMPNNNTWYYIEVTPPLKVVATGPNNTYFEMDYPTSESCPAPIMMRLDDKKTFDTLGLSTSLSLVKCPRSVVRLVNKDQTLVPGTYTIDKASYLMEVFPPLKVVVSGPNARQESNYPTSEECPVPVKMQLDQNVNYDTLVTSTTLSTNVSDVAEAPVVKMGYDINEYGQLVNPTTISSSVEQEREYTLRNEYIPSITSRSIPLLGSTLTGGGQQAS